MSQKYKALTGLELIKGFCSEVLAYGIRNDLDLDGVKIWVSPGIAKALEMGEVLIVEQGSRPYEIPVIPDGDIVEVALDNDKYQSDIFVGNPEWGTGMPEGTALWLSGTVENEN